MSPTTPPGGARETPDGASRDDWQRRQRAEARRSRRAGEPTTGTPPATDSDPYGWSSVPPEPPRQDDPRYSGAPAGPFAGGTPPASFAGAGAGAPGPDARRGGGSPGGPDPDPRWPDEPGADDLWPTGASAEPEPVGAGAPAGRTSRLRGPHRRRAEDGQRTGLAVSQQSDLPTWLQERAVSVAPVRRLLSISVAGFAALLGFGLAAGAYTKPSSYAFVIFGVQVLFVLAWTVAMRPVGARIVAGTGLAAAVAADIAVAWPDHPSLGPLGLITAAAFAVGVVGQLLRGAQRTSATESLGATLLVVIGVVCFAMLNVLARQSLGTQAIVACLVAAGVALVVARLTDVLLTSPRTSPQVPRGSVGVILGAMLGTVAASFMGSVLVGLSPGKAAIAGLVTALVAVMADLAVSYAEAGRDLAGEPQSLWIARHLQGPLGGFALAAPVAYALSVVLLVPSLN